MPTGRLLLPLKAVTALCKRQHQLQCLHLTQLQLQQLQQLKLQQLQLLLQQHKRSLTQLMRSLTLTSLS